MKQFHPRAVGRPPFHSVAMRVVPVSLDAASIKVAKKIGNGSIAAGIRLALKEYT